MKEKKEDPQMSAYIEFIENNKDVIRKIADSNTKKNQDGLTVIEKDDPWREESEWDDFFKELDNNS